MQGFCQFSIQPRNGSTQFGRNTVAAALSGKISAAEAMKTLQKGLWGK